MKIAGLEPCATMRMNFTDALRESKRQLGWSDNFGGSETKLVLREVGKLLWEANAWLGVSQASACSGESFKAEST